MSAADTEVFRPANGQPLILRGAIATGVPQPMDSYKKQGGGPSLAGSRPSSQGGYRFGQMSHNAFFARHNPHPGRVKHIKGLLDVPICSVHDDGFVSNPRYAPSFPPNSFNNNKLNSYSKYFNMPANAINVNSKMHPINTITGLQYFLGKPLNMRIFRDNMQARPGMVPVSEGWRDELHALTDALGVVDKRGGAPDSMQQAGARPRTQYSQATGRLLPPPSRAMSRGGPSRAGGIPPSRQASAALQSIGVDEADTEHMVLGMLCQILQTDDVGAVQQWLVGAGDREKGLVLNMIQSALLSTDQYGVPVPAAPEYRPEPEPLTEEFIGDNDNIDRLTLEPPTPLPPVSRPATQQSGRAASRLASRPASRPASHAAPMPRPPTADAPLKMRYTTSSAGNRDYVPDEAQRPVTSSAFRPATRSSTACSRPATSAAPRTPASLRAPSCHDITEQQANLARVLSVDEGTQTWRPATATVM